MDYARSADTDLIGEDWQGIMTNSGRREVVMIERTLPGYAANAMHGNTTLRKFE